MYVFLVSRHVHILDEFGFSRFVGDFEGLKVG